eukprot:11631984-Alexandrium_andersonii.AAC.1
MSASLVGSEMCIRDRGRLGQRVRGWRASAAPPSASPRRDGQEQAEIAAVSYTHLTLPTICSV